MPGLVGVLKKQDSALDIERLLARMCHIIKHEDWYQTDTFLDESIGMGRVSLGILNPEPQPIFNEDKSLCIIMEGEIYGYDDLKEELISKGHIFSINNDPEFILHLYEEYGKNAFQKLNGIFTITIWHVKKKKLLIANDRYGFRPLHYAETDGKFLFASEMKAILEDKTIKWDINDAGVSDFFYFGSLLGDKTLIKGIKLMTPASVLTYDRDGISISQYWDFFDYSEDSGHSESYYLDRFVDLLSQAVERCSNDTNGRIGASLSGGLDSRVVLACIDKKHYPVHTSTFGIAGCDDARFAQMVAERLGTNHHFYEIGPKYLIEYAEKAVWLTDGMLNCIHSHGISTLNERESHYDIELCGMEGLFTWYSLNQMDKLAKQFAQTQNDRILFQLTTSSLPVAKGNNEIDFMKELFSKAYYNKIKKYPAASFNEINNVVISKLSYGSPFKRIDYYNLTQHQRRFTAYGPVITRSQIETRMPLFDKDVMDFVFRLPPRFRAENKLLYTKGLFEHFPDLSAVPWQKTGLPPRVPEVIEKFYNYYRSGKLKVNKIFNKLGVRRLFADNKHFADYDYWMRNSIELKEYISSIVLSERAINRGYFNPDFINKIIYDHMSGKKNYAHVIGLLLTFELFNRMFVDKQLKG